MKSNGTLVSGGVILRERGKKREWLLVKQTLDSDWELPRVNVRRGESSVRAVLRMSSEQGGMNVRVLEEAGRFNAQVKVSGKEITKLHIYYLMLQKAGTEMIGFADGEWHEYLRASKKLKSKRDQTMLKQAKDVYKKLLEVKKKNVSH